MGVAYSLTTKKVCKFFAPFARFEVLAAVLLRIRVFWDVMPRHWVRHSFITSGGTRRLTQWHISEYWNPFAITLESQCLQTVFLTVLLTLPQGESLCIGLESSVTMYFSENQPVTDAVPIWQLGLLSIPSTRRAPVHYSPHRHHDLSVWHKSSPVFSWGKYIIVYCLVLLTLRCQI